LRVSGEGQVPALGLRLAVRAVWSLESAQALQQLPPEAFGLGYKDNHDEPVVRSVMHRVTRRLISATTE